MKKRLIGLAILAFSSLSLAQSQRIGSWSYGDLDSGVGMYAGTVNDSGGFLVQQCLAETDNCYWIMSTDTTCKEEDSYHALLNSTDGSSPIELYCFKIGKQFRTAFKDFQLISKRVKSGGVLSIVVPMASGEFRVNRFDMTGGDAAVSAMNRRFTDQSRKSTKSRTL